jgi:hypothetical protein
LFWLDPARPFAGHPPIGGFTGRDLDLRRAHPVREDFMRHLNLGSVLSVTALTASTFGALAGDAARPNLTTRACAERDLQYVILLERHGEAQDIPGDVLAQSFFTMMRARKACRQGREQDAFAIYDSIKLVPTTTQ